jgi:peptidoglycan/LPS O-acetylase OafA/YrhL
MIAARYRAFGALRCLLALMVAVHHFQYLLPEAWRGPFHALGLGVTAVAVFFVISGFIVAEATASFYRARPGAFLLNRLLRLVPPYLAALAVSVAAHQLLWQAGMLRVWDFTFAEAPVAPRLLLGSLAALLPFVHGGQGGEIEFIPYVWSLRVEIAFYLVVCVLAMVLPRAARRLRLAPAAAVDLCFAAGFAGTALLLVTGRPLMLLDIPFFLLGIAIFRVWRQPAADRLALCAAAAAASWWSMRNWPQPPGRLADLQGLIFLALAAAFVLAGRLHLPQHLRRLDSALGSLSYPIYLNHYIVGILLFDGTTSRGWPLFAAGLLLSVLLAAVMHRIVEVPLYGLRNLVRGAAL